MREEKSNSVEDNRNFGYKDDRACPDIAHYNFSASLQSCGLFRGTYGSALRTRQRLPPYATRPKSDPLFGNSA